MRWREYVPVHQRRSEGLAKAQRAVGKGKTLQPIQIAGRKIAKSFWGGSWCEHFESYSDYANRLPRGRTYVRNGSIVHLEITSGKITAMVAGSDLYRVKINIDKMPAKAWKQLCRQCTASVTSTIDLLRGKLPAPILETLTDPDNDLFPRSKEIRLSCDCPDWAGLCKHLAAVLYGVGSRLDDSPELLFLLRGVDPNALIGNSLAEVTEGSASLAGAQVLEAESGLEDIFGIDLIDRPDASSLKSKAKSSPKKRSKTTKNAKKKTGRKKVAPKPTKKVVRKKAAKKKAAKKKARKKPPVAKKPAKKKAAPKKKAAKKRADVAKKAVAKKKPSKKKSASSRIASKKTARQATTQAKEPRKRKKKRTK